MTLVKHASRKVELLSVWNGRYFHRAIARATSFKLVMRHFAPSPTSEARR